MDSEQETATLVDATGSDMLLCLNKVVKGLEEENEILSRRVKELEQYVDWLPEAADGGKLHLGQIVYFGPERKPVIIKIINWNADQKTSYASMCAVPGGPAFTDRAEYLSTIYTEPKRVTAPIPAVPVVVVQPAVLGLPVPDGYVITKAFQSTSNPKCFWRVMVNADGHERLHIYDLGFVNPYSAYSWGESSYASVNTLIRAANPNTARVEDLPGYTPASSTAVPVPNASGIPVPDGYTVVAAYARGGDSQLYWRVMRDADGNELLHCWDVITGDRRAWMQSMYDHTSAMIDAFHPIQIPIEDLPT